MKALILGALVLTLTACQTTRPPPLIVRSKTVVMPPKEFFRCTGVKFPNPDRLTDKQVAHLLVAMERANAECRSNMAAIRQYLLDAQRRVK